MIRNRLMYFLVLFLAIPFNSILAEQVVHEAGVPAKAKTMDPVSRAVGEFSRQLKLTPGQSAKIKKVIAMAQEQMKRDRQMFKSNIPALTEAAKRRRDMTEYHIKSTLTPEQQKKFPEAAPVIHLNDEVVLLMERMSMNYGQGYQAAGIFLKEKKQEETDRKTHHQSAMALISAARFRRETVDRDINSILNPEQQKVFYIRTRDRNRDHEMFMLEHGLMLSPEQTAQVKSIVEKHRKEMRDLMKNKRNDMQARMGGGGGMGGGRGGMGGGMGRGGMGGGRGGMGGGMKGGRGGMSGGKRGGMNSKEMQKLRTKRMNAIMALLNPHQQNLYSQIADMMKQEREKRTKRR